MSVPNVAAHWVGHYTNWDKEHPISADLVVADGRLTGRMRDGRPHHEVPISKIAMHLGLPPGADERIVANLREEHPEAPHGPVHYFVDLPTDATLEGTVQGNRVSFLKTYLGESFGGFVMGGMRIGKPRDGHSVNYEGRLDEAGTIIEGRWWIDASPREGIRRTEGTFILRRADGRDVPPGPAETSKPTPRRPWWKFW